MRNRAKCKLCNEIIESFHATDYVTCKCGEISIDGGLDSLKARANNWFNFFRVDDEGNEVVVKFKESSDENKKDKPNKKEMISMLKDMIKSYENLPQHAMMLPINHYDFSSALLLISEILALGDWTDDI